MEKISWQAHYKSKEIFPLTPFGYPIIKSETTLVLDELTKSKQPLNFGCGEKQFSEKEIKVDIDPNVKGVYRNLNEVIEQVDLVYAINVIEHLDLNEIHELFAWTKENAKTLIINPPNPWCSNGGFACDITHKTFYSHRAYGGLLVEAGFKQIEFYRISNASFKPVRQFVGSFIGLDFCQTIGIVARV